jgi:flagella basal body P-ring formation protein FlgA
MGGKRKSPMVLKRGWARLASAILLSGSVSSVPAGAAVPESAASIRAAIDTALQSRFRGTDITAEIGAIDARLRLPSCPAIEVNLPGANTPVMAAKIDCLSPTWTVYVPVRLHSWTEAVVAATNLPPNTKLTAGELARARVDMFAVQGGLITDLRRAEGMVLRVGVVAGSPILASHLAQPLVVRRGQQVPLTLTDATMTIRNTVVALEDGRIGDSIAVQNQATRKTIHATVAGDGTVQIKF